jgi:hypothetical protein
MGNITELCGLRAFIKGNQGITDVIFLNGFAIDESSSRETFIPDYDFDCFEHFLNLITMGCRARFGHVFERLVLVGFDI